MSAIRLASIVSLMGVLSCGGGTNNTGSSGSPPTSPPGDDGGGTTGPGPTGPGPTADETVTLTMGPFTVPPSTEVFKCQPFKNPFGVDQDIKEYEVHMSEGSHHMFLFFDNVTADGPIEDCPSGGLEFHPYPFSTMTRDANFRYPDDVGSLVPATTGFLLNAHYINPGATPIQATVTAVLHKAAPGSVTQHAGVIFMNDLRLTVPPGASTSKSTCPLPGGIHLMTAVSHMHQRATGFTATTADGTTLYQTDQWSDPAPRIFTPPLDIAQPTTVTWSCNYQNETSQTLTFGEYAQTNVMCIFGGQYWPTTDPTNPNIECQR
jgi:hypothetical protein